MLAETMPLTKEKYTKSTKNKLTMLHTYTKATGK